MSVKYFFTDIQAWVELIENKTVHVKTTSGGYDKTVQTYEYTCRWCQSTGTARSLEAVKYLAGQHTETHPSMAAASP